MRFKIWWEEVAEVVWRDACSSSLLERLYIALLYISPPFFTESLQWISSPTSCHSTSVYAKSIFREPSKIET